MKLNEIQSPGVGAKKDVTIETKLKRLGREVCTTIHGKYYPQYSVTWEGKEAISTWDTRYYIRLEFDAGNMAVQTKSSTRTYGMTLYISERRGVMNISNLLDTDDEEVAAELEKKFTEKAKLTPLETTLEDFGEAFFEELMKRFKQRYPAFIAMDFSELRMKSSGVQERVFKRYDPAEVRAIIKKKFENHMLRATANQRNLDFSFAFRLVFSDSDNTTFRAKPYLVKIDQLFKRSVERLGHKYTYPHKYYQKENADFFLSMITNDELIVYPAMYNDSIFDEKGSRRVELQFHRADEIAKNTRSILDDVKPRLEKLTMPATYEITFGPRPDLEDLAKPFKEYADEFKKVPMITVKVTKK